MKQKQTFSLVSDIDVWTVFNFSQFYEHIFRNNRSKMFKIGAPINLAIFWIKKRLQHRYFPVSITKFLRTAFL